MLLRVEDLRTYFRSDGPPVKAVDGVSFTVDYGETFCLVGESGSGKSVTSLSIIQLVAQSTGYHPTGQIGLYPSTQERISTREDALPGAGSGPVELISLPEQEKRRIRGSRISMIFQEPMTSLNPVLTVGEQIMEPLMDHMGMSARDARDRATEMLELVHMPAPKQHIREYPHQLSGGMRQRVMIAMAMACEPDLLIADEPTTALDVTIQAEILKLMKELQEKRGTAILFITHDLSVVNQIADRIAVMRLGKIVETGTRAEVLGNPRHTYTQELLAALPVNLKTRRDALIEEARKKAEAEGVPGVTASDYATQDGAGTDAAPPTEPAIVQLKDTKVYFPIRKGLLRRHVGDVKAVDGVTLDILRGKIVALVGESGSGKTTLGRAVLRLVNTTAG